MVDCRGASNVVEAQLERFWVAGYSEKGRIELPLVRFSVDAASFVMDEWAADIWWGGARRIGTLHLYVVVYVATLGSLKRRKGEG
jgi:hypothetical protein